jgi:regulator of CtrA degradation
MELTDKVINALYVEAMLLSDEARAYFDAFGRNDREAMTPLQRVSFSCESLKVTTRLMHVIAWLISHRALGIDSDASGLGAAAKSDPETVASLPAAARQLISTSEDLYARVERLDLQLRDGEPAPNAAHGLMSRLVRAF